MRKEEKATLTGCNTWFAARVYPHGRSLDLFIVGVLSGFKSHEVSSRQVSILILTALRLGQFQSPLLSDERLCQRLPLRWISGRMGNIGNDI